MKSIWKFEINKHGTVEIQMPAGAEVLTVQMQRGRPVMWAVVNDNNMPDYRYFAVLPTGCELSEYPGRYVATYQDLEGLVWHVFEKAA